MRMEARVTKDSGAQKQTSGGIFQHRCILSLREIKHKAISDDSDSAGMENRL